MNEWEGKCIFYSPKIMTGCDFSIDTKQQEFFHMKGDSVLPTSSFQMICRTRNMKSLTWYAAPPKTHKLKFKSLEHVREMAAQHKENTNLYMCSSYLDADDNIQFAPNSFYNIYTFNEYVKDIYDNNKIEHLKQIIIDNGFECSEDMLEEAQKLDKKVVSEMKDVTDDAIEETFKQWMNKEVEVEMFNTRSAMLGLSIDDDKNKYKDFIVDKYTFKDHLKLKLLLKEKSFIDSKASTSIENSYAEFGLNNIYSKIKMIAEFEKQTNIKRFDYSDAACGTIDDKTWTMIQKMFRKKNIKPSTNKDVVTEYIAMINHIVKLYAGERVGDNNKANNRVYRLDTCKLQQSFELDYITMSAINPLKNYDKELIERIGLTFPDFEIDEFENVIFDE